MVRETPVKKKYITVKDYNKIFIKNILVKFEAHERILYLFLPFYYLSFSSKKEVLAETLWTLKLLVGKS